MPTPNPGESREDFISRCMASEEARNTAPDQDARLGLCFGLWDQSRKEDAVAEFRKSDDELQIVWAEVYVPGIPDSHGEFMKADTIRRAAWDFLARAFTQNTNIEHEHDAKESVVVESFVARKGDPDFIADAWVVGMHVPDPNVWALIKSGEINGFSLEGLATKADEAEVLKLDVPRVLFLQTEPDDTGHDHEVELQFNADGQFVGGVALTAGPPPGHKHEIARGTVTEEAEGHAHRYNLTRALADANADPES